MELSSGDEKGVEGVTPRRGVDDRVPWVGSVAAAARGPMLERAARKVGWHGNFEMNGNDVHRLLYNEWLSDQVIAAAMIYINGARRRECVAYSPYAAHSLRTRRHRSTVLTDPRRSSLRAKGMSVGELLEMELLLLPLNLDNIHWVLMAVWPKRAVARYYDSQGNVGGGAGDESRKASAIG